MEYGKHCLGSTSCAVTELGLGTAPLGGLYAPVNDENALATLEAAWSQGIRFFDTAPQYGNGSAERRLGAFLKAKPREDYVLATKVGRLLRIPDQPVGEDAYYKGTPPERPVFDFSYDGIMRSFEESLTRLDAERVDILHIHDPDDHYTAAIDGAYKALDSLRAQGVVKAVGAGMNQSEMLTRFARDGVFDCFLLAGRYTLLEQGALQEFLPLCEERGISVIAAGVYNSGILADPRANAKFNYADADQTLIQRALRIEGICLEHGVPLKAAAMQFAAAHPAVASTLTGARMPQEIEENIAMYSFPIPVDLWAALREDGVIVPAAPVPGEISGLRK
ncbi:aldo/keto reductase [Paraburkholderia sp. 1N]|uniref:Aldo/keto reductase n=1 Tax=Paraburkholderia solitsugae TaxID=2675748 RepID=A0ABX2BRV6_9BURK|nr:aldo/keto reductase [Paraburkholderia solitsugae]NPT43476.1 aldo/keto reductase [Paraburkholderia solitsugae]